MQSIINGFMCLVFISCCFGGIPVIDFGCTIPGSIGSNLAIQFSPQDVKPNTDYTIYTSGVLSEDVNGGTIHLIISSHGLQILSKDYPICSNTFTNNGESIVEYKSHPFEGITMVNTTCPISKGLFKITFQTRTPKEIGWFGKINLNTTATSNTNKEIFCASGYVDFN
eukprot:NODE_8776_length_647_cov_28.337786_g8151_i0.p1 GENE.NODE_8776_length_647_cov_28.337786_g8151_i0~~NODE_8776_length_647_cov_28.337786_g8151_i0.p1  ORF type:complete len:168 (-),score=22.40 NODE_8776_length_647_cov_28.337786_g8151_i0:88-591(-)